MRACECSVKELDCSDISPTRLTGAAGCIIELGRHMGGCSREREARRQGGSAVGVLERPGRPVVRVGGRGALVTLVSSGGGGALR